MNRKSDNLFGRSLMVYAAVAVAIFASSAALAHGGLELQLATGPDATRAKTIVSKSGSFVLSRNLSVTAAGVDGVLITASNVTLDLQGFVITGASGTANGIEVAAGLTNVVILDGIITGFGGAGVLAGSDTATSITGLNVQGNGTGISCGIGSLVQSNIIQGNLGEGLSFSDTTGGFLGNILQGNDSNTSPGTTGQVNGGTSLGHNLCNGSPC
jgi:hypothetical protein